MRRHPNSKYWYLSGLEDDAIEAASLLNRFTGTDHYEARRHMVRNGHQDTKWGVFCTGPVTGFVPTHDWIKT